MTTGKNKSTTGTTRSGCFVYRILVEDIEVRSAPREAEEEEVENYGDDKTTNGDGAKRRKYLTGDLVSVDLVLYDRLEHKEGRLGGGGPSYLRLSDGSGWLCCSSSSLEEVPVEAGLWSFYIDNDNAGIISQSHPMVMDPHDDNDNQYYIQHDFLPPMLRVYCDQRVRGNDGVTFYRLQGDYGCTSWVYDKRRINITTNQRKSSRSSSSSNDYPSISPTKQTTMQSATQTKTIIVLHPESQVHSGSFAYRALRTLNIQCSPSINESASTTNQVQKNEIVFCDIILEESAAATCCGGGYNNDSSNSSSSSKYGNGPFIRLSDGTGWLSLCQRGVLELAEVPMEVGKWKLRVNKDSAKEGIKLQEQPSDYEYYHSKVNPKNNKNDDDAVFYPKNDILICDRRIVGSGASANSRNSSSSSGSKSTFYRVEGTNRWLRHSKGTKTRELRPGDVEYDNHDNLETTSNRRQF